MKDNLVVKSNQIIQASYFLTVNEQRLLLACISQLDSREEDLDITKGFTLTVEEAQDLFYSDKDRKNAYRDLKDATENLYRREIKLLENEENYTLTRWISSAIIDGDGLTVTLYFHEQIKPYISQLRNNFTEYRLGNIVQLTSVYAIRMYELIVSWSFNSSYKKMEIRELRELLNLDNKYKQHNDFDRYVITPAVKQINEFTDFEIEISFKKKGRSFKFVQLRYQQKEDARKTEEQRKIDRNSANREISSRDENTSDLFIGLSDKQIYFVARNRIFQEHLGAMGKLPQGEKYGSERVISVASDYIKKGDFDEITKAIIMITLGKIKQKKETI